MEIWQSGNRRILKLSSMETGGRLAENIQQFAWTLRSAGLPIGTKQLIDSLTAVRITGIESRRTLYWTLRAVLVHKQSDQRLFNQCFHLYFRNPRLLEKMMALLLTTVHREADEKSSEAAIRRMLEALAQTQDSVSESTEVEFEQRESGSDREILRKKDFEQMTLAELQEVKRLLIFEQLLLPHQRVRRFRLDSRGDRYDLREGLRQMQRGNPDLLPLARKRRRTRAQDIVLICDISGSMSTYSRMFLHFAHALARTEAVVHSFVFGTRLTNVTRRLQHRDVDESLRLIASDVKDWDGGTRIAACLRQFNQDWGRRVLARNATVILLSDGLERDAKVDLEFQMRRLKRSCQQLIWMNPMLRYDKFEPRASGIQKMLPHVDRFVSGHNLDSITGLFETLRQPERRL